MADIQAVCHSNSRSTTFLCKNIRVTSGQIRPNDVADDFFEGDDIVSGKPHEVPKYIQHSQPIGIAAVLAGVVFLVAANVLGTKFGRSGLWITVWRSFIAAAILGVYVKIRKQNITFESMKYCLVPAIAFTIHIICFYQAIQDTTLTNVVIIRSMQPALVLLFVGAQFNEKVKFSNVIASITAFCGVLLTVWGTALTGANNVRGNLLAIGALFAWAALFIFTKKARQHVGTASFMFLTTCLSGLVACLILPFTGEALLPTGHELEKLLAMAVCASLGHGFISWSHRYAKLTTVSVLTLFTPVGSTICAAIFFDQQVTALIAVGITIVMVSVATIVTTDSAKKSDVDEAHLDKAQAA